MAESVSCPLSQERSFRCKCPPDMQAVVFGTEEGRALEADRGAVVLRIYEPLRSMRRVQHRLAPTLSRRQSAMSDLMA
jgi:hypothetical protein